jgi:hypothetical protein
MSTHLNRGEGEGVSNLLRTIVKIEGFVRFCVTRGRGSKISKNCVRILCALPWVWDCDQLCAQPHNSFSNSLAESRYQIWNFTQPLYSFDINKEWTQELEFKRSIRDVNVSTVPPRFLMYEIKCKLIVKINASWEIQQIPFTTACWKFKILWIIEDNARPIWSILDVKLYYFFILINFNFLNGMPKKYI